MLNQRLINQGLLVICVVMIIFYKEVNKFGDKLLSVKRVDHKQKKNKLVVDYKPLIYLIPIVIFIYFDSIAPEMTQLLGFYDLVPQKTLEYLLRIFGAYGIVQVLAQDLGIKTGANQRNLVQIPVVQAFLLWGGAYSLTGVKSEGLMAVLLYFGLKYNVSAGKLSNVCFEDV